MERRFNDLRREFLDQEVQAVHRWLTVLAVILTVMGVLVPIAAYFGFRRFHEIEREAQAVLKEIRGHEQEAQQRVDRIGVTAEDAAKNEKVLKEAQAATEAPGASLIDVAVTEALTLQQKGRIKDAIAKWEAIAILVENTDKNQAARAHYSVGYLYANFGTEIQNGSTSEDAQERAIRSFNEAIRLQPGHANAYFNRGASKAELKQYKAAIADCDQAIRLQPDHASAYHNRGISKASLEQYESAIIDFDEAIRLRPEDESSYYGRGISRGRLEEYERAIADFDEAIRLRPEYAQAYVGRGAAKAELKQYEAAITDLDKAIGLQPDHSDAYFARGASKAELGQHEAAIADLDEAIRLQPDHTGSYEKRALSKAELGQNDGAASDRAQAARLAAETDRPDSLSG